MLGYMLQLKTDFQRRVYHGGSFSEEIQQKREILKRAKWIHITNRRSEIGDYCKRFIMKYNK